MVTEVGVVDLGKYLNFIQILYFGICIQNIFFFQKHANANLFTG